MGSINVWCGALVLQAVQGVYVSVVRDSYNFFIALLAWTPHDQHSKHSLSEMKMTAGRKANTAIMENTLKKLVLQKRSGGRLGEWISKLRFRCNEVIE